MTNLLPSLSKESLYSEDLLALLAGEHSSPHSFLGLHLHRDKTKVIRIWRPYASTLSIEVFGEIVETKRVDERGLFEYIVPFHTTFRDYRIYHTCGLLAFDPYAFPHSFGEMDHHLFSKGRHYELYNVLGAKEKILEGVKGAFFALWAPSAKGVSLVADFNHWEEGASPMRCLGESGVWELFVPSVGEGEKYKFQITTALGERFLKADPYAYYSEMRPKTASQLFNIDNYPWQDGDWIRKRLSQKGRSAPMNIYEIHLGSWNRQDGQFLNYREAAHRLASYCRFMGFTHVEFMPLMEHPLDESWGYQVTGFYSVTSRFGKPSDFQYLVDYLHRHNIGVILDWVPAHFPCDDFALSKFDGSSLFEHQDPRQGFHPHWKTLIFNYERHEISNFLIANALFWFEKMHIDGLRVDAVASMLYLDYGREEGEWIPNREGGKENLGAVEFLKHLNSIVHERHPGVLMIAEESTAFPGVTQPVEEGGLGFDMKWNLGWMNDTLCYFEKDPLFRSYDHDHLTFFLLYAFTEKFALVLSHDEVVHGKKSLLEKMPGDRWQQFANLRLLYSYMICQPGKNLIFMGGEFGQIKEWNSQEEIAWGLLDDPLHLGMQEMVRQLNRLVIDSPPLWERDFDWQGFEWVDFADRKNSVVSYRRKAEEEEFLIIHNFTPGYHEDYQIKLPEFLRLEEIFNSDHFDYGGSGKVGRRVQLVDGGFSIDLPPMATVIFRMEK